MIFCLRRLLFWRFNIQYVHVNNSLTGFKTTTGFQAWMLLRTIQFNNAQPHRETWHLSDNYDLVPTFTWRTAAGPRAATAAASMRTLNFHFIEFPWDFGVNLFEIVLRLPPLSTAKVGKQNPKHVRHLTRKVIKGAIHQNTKREQDRTDEGNA